MAATRFVEEERGTYSGSVHPHNGYYAGDFSHRDGLATIESSARLLASMPRVRLTDAQNPHR